MLVSLFKMECLLRLRHLQECLYPIVFFLITMSLFPLAFSPDPVFLQTYFSGCAWFSAIFATLLSIQTIFLSDTEDAHLEQIFLSDTPHTLLIAVKLAAYWCVSTLPLILLTPFVGLLLSLPADINITLTMTLLFGTPMIMLIGSLGVALTLGLRQQGVLLGLIILPLLAPVLIFGVNITREVAGNFSIKAPIAFFIGISLFSILLLPFAVTVCLRISLDD